MSEWWQEMRAQFPVCENWTYLNHAAVAPLPRCCSDAVRGYLDEVALNGIVHYPATIEQPLGRVRRLGARLIGARPDQIFVVRSTTQGLSVAATGVPFASGDNVVLVEREFPANLRPWLPLGDRGVEVRFTPQRDGRIDLDAMRDLVDDRTRVVSVSHVQFFSGYRTDLAPLAELCRDHDALLCVDAIQSAGAMPIDVEPWGVDFLSADAHKWQLGPEGVGIGYVSDRALARIVPAVQGWLSVERPFDFFDLEQPLKRDASRFEEGALNTAGVHALAASLEMLLGCGTNRIAARILELTDRCAEGLLARGWALVSPRDVDREKSGIVTVRRPGIDMDALGERLQQAGFVIAIRDGALRVAPHAYNTQDEIDALLTELEAHDGR